MRILYDLLVYLLRPFAVAVVLWRGLRNRGYWAGFGERFGFGAAAAGRTLWVHAVSLGEVTAAAPIVRAVQARHPQLAVILTTATPTGRARARALYGTSVDVRYLPYDTPGSMRRFLKRVQPRAAIIMETELWPNLFHQCRRRGVPVVLASARLSPRSVARYLRFSGVFRGVFSADTVVAAQSVEDAARFIAIGAQPDRTQVIGNVKFDVGVDAEAVERGIRLRATWAPRPVWIAGSTHEGEEEQVLTAHARVLEQQPGTLLLVVPRHPERFAAVADLLERRGFRYHRRSDARPLPAGTQVFLVDTVGELRSMYAAVDVAFVGGSLVPVGGHNLLEPAALGVPVITGPYQSNGQEIARLLLERGGALEVADAGALGERVGELLGDPERRRRIGASGLEVVAANRGSVGRLLDLVDRLLFQ